MSEWYTPNATVKETITSIRWSFAIAFFIAPPTLAGFQEGVPILGFAIGFGFILFVLFLQWWWGPV